MKLSELDFKPMATLPWVVDEEFDEDSDYRYQMPMGVVLRRPKPPETFMGYTVVGNNVSGPRTQGCTCCAHPWKDSVDRYDGWAWLPGFPLEKA